MIGLIATAALALEPAPRDVLKHPFGGRAPVIENLSGAIQSGWDMQHYEIHAEFDLNAKAVDTKIRMIARSRRDGPGALTLHANGPTISEVRVQGEAVEYTVVGQEVRVPMPEIPQGEDAEVTVLSSAGLGDGEALGVHWDGETLFSFHEPQGARLWLVTYDDPSDKATLEWHITVDSELVVAANGVHTGTEALENGRSTWNFVFDELIPTYLFVVHASDYEILEDQMSDGRPIVHHIRPGTERDAWVAFEKTPDILDHFADLFGEYPWGSYGHAVAPFGGAMEHTTMTTFGDSLIGRSYGEIVNAHEVAHHWFGDYVTLADWPEIWLNEGFASYGEVIWYEDYYGETGRRQYVGSQIDSYFNWQNYEGLSSVYDPNYLFGGAVYDKGSVVLDMLRTYMGDDAFFTSVRNYVDSYAHGVATTSDLVEEVSLVAGEDMQWFFDQWVYRKGDPEISTGWTSTELEDGGVQVDIRVQQNTDELWAFPLTLRWRAGSDVVEEEVWVDAESTTFTFCSETGTTGLQVDPDDEVLFADNRLVSGPEEVTLSCGDLTEEPGPGDSPGDGFEPYGQGEAEVTVGNCSAPVSGVRWGVLALVGAVALRRRR